MSEEQKVEFRWNRRGFLIRGSAALGTGALVLLWGRSARANDPPLLSLADPEAKKLHYTDDASKIDRSSNPAYIPGSKCANCNFFRGSGATGACSFFPGKAVNANGWCSGYSQMQDAE
jgi:hypothetical protein